MRSEEEQNQAPRSSEDGDAAPVGGERLAATRRERGISVREIAKELHLDEPKVRALEENRFDVLGAPVFAKGHLRKYAELVGVPIDDVLADYYQLNRSAGAPPVVGPPRKVYREIPMRPWVVGIIAVLALAVAAWWWFNRAPAADPIATEPATLNPFESERQDEATQPVEASSSLVAASGAIESNEQAQRSSIGEDPRPAAVEAVSESRPGPVTGAESPDNENAVAGSGVELKLAFHGDCWTEVTDATGRRLYFALAREGGSVTLSGVGPLGVLLGNSSNVSLRVNGFDYSVPAANRRGNTARLTIYGQ